MRQPRTRGSRGRTAMLVAAVALLSACEREAPEPAEEPEVGVPEEVTYELVRTQAGELPALLGESEGCRYLAAAGAVTLTTDREFSASMIRVRDCGPETEEEEMMDTGGGRYSIAGDSVYFRYDVGGSAGVGYLSGDSLVVRGPGQTFTYRRTDL